MEEFLAKLRAALRTRGALSRLSERSGLAHSTILRIANGTNANPGILTVEALEKALGELCPGQARAAVVSADDDDLRRSMEGSDAVS